MRSIRELNTQLLAHFFHFLPLMNVFDIGSSEEDDDENIIQEE